MGRGRIVIETPSIELPYRIDCEMI